MTARNTIKIILIKQQIYLELKGNKWPFLNFSQFIAIKPLLQFEVGGIEWLKQNKMHNTLK